jgi:uncharacterized protein (DUF488 family)
MTNLFTIGHSNHSLEHFLELLRLQSISAICDVRSSPYSKYSPQFGKDVLANALPNADVAYVFLGREIGARRSEESCYVGGRAKYDLIAQLPIFREGLERVLQGMETHIVALMCSEADPLTCHRTILLCRELLKMRPELRITHILGDGTTETQEEAQERLVKLHKLQRELFGELTSEAALVNRAFELQAERLECREEEIET